jgi:hypothetical protein
MTGLNHGFVGCTGQVLTRNRRDLVAGVAQDIYAAATEILIEFSFMPER